LELAVLDAGEVEPELELLPQPAATSAIATAIALVSRSARFPIPLLMPASFNFARILAA
jgi:hypothetical protein